MSKSDISVSRNFLFLTETTYGITSMTLFRYFLQDEIQELFVKFREFICDI